MESVTEILMARRLCINYVSPAICEGDTSGSGFGTPIIVLEPFGAIPQVGGLVVAGEFPGPFTLNWTPVPGALCYNIYQVVGEELVLVFECVPQGPGGVTLPPGSPGGGDTYVVTPITPGGEGSPGNPVTTPSSPPSDFWDFTWQITEDFPGIPTGGFSGESFLVDRFEITGMQPQRDPETGLNTLRKWEGTFIYTGLARPSHLHLEVSDILGPGAGQHFEIELLQDGIPFFSILISDLTTVGVYEYDFTVPLSAGAVISCIVFMVMGHEDSVTRNHWKGLLT